LGNLQFFQDNAESSLLPDGAFDLVHFTYVLHEMPRANARQVLSECWRLLEPGGTLSIMDSQCFGDFDTMLGRARWARRIEPFLQEYVKLDLPATLLAMGFEDLQIHDTRSQGVFVTVTRPG
jgi:ubiquinone/menaquinone biosynthesis C-methylase UbiE